ncbi:MAG: molybdopterin-dependent oxidoreductase [Streptosporangiales bacterium]|nr:molybdopterin-dependent oxidoreductase [Streptosporangiales bacterium]
MVVTGRGGPVAEIRYGTCPLCEASCGLQIELNGETITSIRGSTDDPLSQGYLCPKAVALQDLPDDPDRLRTPVRRTADGWQPIGWPEALDAVATGLADVQRRHGNDGLAVYLGNPNVHNLGFLTHGLPFVGMLRTRSRYSASSVDQLPHQLAAYHLYGHQLFLPVPDIDRTQYFLVLGANPMVSNGSMMTAPGMPARLRRLRERGGRLVVVDPRRTETARHADEHHFVRPGSDALFLLALLRTVLAEDLATPAPYVDGLDAVHEAVDPFTPERVAERTGIPAEATRRIAVDFATAPAAACYGRMGVSTQRFGALCQWAIQVLNIATGNLDRPGGTMVTHPAVQVVGSPQIGPGHHGRWHSRVRGLAEFAGELPVATLAEEIRTPGERQMRGLLTVAGNPVLSTPGGKALDDALGELDFMVAIDPYLNDTTRHADIVLPPTGPLENDHYDLVFNALAVRNTARFSPPVLAKPDGSMHEWEIYRELVRRYRKVAPRRRGLRGDRTTYLTTRMSPRRLVDLALRAGPYRLSVKRLLRAPQGVDLGPLRPCLPGRLQTADNRIDCAPEVLLRDVDRAAAELATSPRPGELLLIGRRHLRSNNSWLHNTPRLTKGKARHLMLIHPDDLAARDLADGDRVRVRSRVDTIELEASASTDVMPGVVSIPHGFGHSPDGTRLEVAAAIGGASPNDLTDPADVDAVSGNAVLNGVTVQVEPA